MKAETSFIFEPITKQVRQLARSKNRKNIYKTNLERSYFESCKSLSKNVRLSIPTAFVFLYDCLSVRFFGYYFQIKKKLIIHIPLFTSTVFVLFFRTASENGAITLVKKKNLICFLSNTLHTNK